MVIHVLEKNKAGKGDREYWVLAFLYWASGPD